MKTDTLSQDTAAPGASGTPGVRVEIATQESAGNRDPLNCRYELNGAGYFGRISAADGAAMLAEMRRNGSFRDVTEGQSGGGVWRFYYVGSVPAEMVRAARRDGKGVPTP